MKINPQIFRSYDIRGIYPKEINEKFAYFLGPAFVKFLKKKEPKIVLGRDNRSSSPSLFKALRRGLLEQGTEIIDIGLSTTPMLYWATAFYRADAGIEITASHNPPQYNGFKLVRKKAVPISGKSGLEKIKNLVLEGKFNKGKMGKIKKKSVVKEYIEFNFKEFDRSKIDKDLKIVIDTANAVSGILVPWLRKKLPIKVFSLFEKLDSRFPHHSPDPLIEKNLVFLKKEIKERKANVGVAFDGDGDRIIFVDERGKKVGNDLILALLSQYILKEQKGEKILYDIRSSNVVPETIEKCGGKAIISKIGHAFIKEKMRKEKIFFGGEFSGHYYHRKHFFAESPIFVLLKILEIISFKKEPLSGTIQPFKKYFHSGEFNFKSEKKEEILNFLEKKYKAGKISKIDGLRIDFKDWWFLLRPSGTEPLLRLVVEAKKEEKMKEKQREIISFIKKFK